MIIGLGAAMRRPDSMIKLHMPFDGEVSVFRDRAGKGIASNQGTNPPVQSIAKRKFVGKSLWCNWSGSGFDTDIYYADNNDWYIGTNAFTIKFWLYLTNLPINSKTYRFTGQTNSSGQYTIFLAIYCSGSNYYFDLGLLQTTLYWYQAYAFQTNTWYHMLFHRDTNNNMRMFVNGIQIGTTKNDSTNITDNSGPWSIGTWSTYTGGSGLQGYIDEYTFIKGRGEWPRGLGHTPEASPLSRRY